MIDYSNATQIWPDVSRNLISADRNDLPPGIRAIRVPTFNEAALRGAMDLMRGKVHTVQIEADDVPKELMCFPHQLRQEIGYFDMEADVFDPFLRPNRPEQISRQIAGFMDGTLAKKSAGEHGALLQEWKRQLIKMPEVARHVWPGSYMGMWIYGNGRTDHKEGALPHFHTHAPLLLPVGSQKPLPGYFLNFVPSGDGTVFKNGDHELWYAKANTFNLHITEGHFRAEGPEHASPDQFMSPIADEKRATGILQIYPSL